MITVGLLGSNSAGAKFSIQGIRVAASRYSTITIRASSLTLLIIAKPHTY